MKRSTAALILFLGAFAFYAHFAAPSVTTGDSGEFITAATTLAVPHAPSFPTYTVIGKAVVTAFPFGSPGYRTNLFSALASAGALALVFVLLASAGVSLAASVLTAVLFGLTTSQWENSLVTEVFALNIVLVAALLLCALKEQWPLFFFMAGLAFGNHQIVLFLMPAVAAVHWRRLLAIRSQAALLAFLFTLGFSVYLVLPIRSIKEPPLNWGRPTTINNLYRTITRKDYGSLKLTVDEKLARNTETALAQMKFFSRHLVKEVPWPALALGLFAFVVGFRRQDKTTLMLAVLFLFAGPFFLLLGNMPLNAQSDGIIGRFMVMPALAIVAAAPLALRERRWVGVGVLVVSIAVAFQSSIAMARETRSTRLVYDYGNAMLRTLPKNAVLFLEGGDDAFYSLAMLRYAMGRRPDVSLHDRGGLVFKSPYGDDFRRLPKEERQARRLQVEAAAARVRPVYYSTMDHTLAPDWGLIQTGFLMKGTPTSATEMSWPVIILRSLYPLEPDLYRMRALGCFFPFMLGQDLAVKKQTDAAIRTFHRAAAMGHDIDWLQTNLAAEYARLAYAALSDNDLLSAKKLYEAWRDFDPQSLGANSNLGVVYERMGNLPAAAEQYAKTARLFPTAADPVFNLSVLAWRAGNWPEVIRNLEEVLRRKPDHAEAQRYLAMARARMKT